MAISSILSVLMFVFLVRADQACKESLKKCVVKSSFDGLPTTQDQIISLCSAYKSGMNCIRNWQNECLTPEKKEIAEKQIENAQFFMRMLCDDEIFRKDYLNHTDCFSGVSDDWIRCTKNFQETANVINKRRDLTSTNQFIIDTCCAKHGFNKCILHASRAKCDRAGAILLRKISETLSKEKHCEHFEYSICGATKNRGFFILLFTLFSLLLWFRRLFNVC